MSLASRIAAVVTTAALATGCASQDIPQAYRGRVFARTGALAFYSGKTGFTGPVLGPGTYFTGTYNELHMVECATVTMREPLNALTKDGVQFGVDIYVRFSASCDDRSVQTILDRVVPDANGVISAKTLYDIFVRPAVGEAVRHTVSPYRANDINDAREDVIAAIRKNFIELVNNADRGLITVYEVNLTNLDFPDAMDAANVDRAVQAVLRDKAIAERDKVEAEIKTAEMRRELAEKEGEVAAVRIDKIGQALRRNPDYLQYDLQQKMPEIYQAAGERGNMVIAAPSPTALNLPAPRGGAALPAPALVPPSARPQHVDRENERK